MAIAKCPACSKDFEVKPYRLSPNRSHPPCCSMTCARKMLKSLGYKPWNSKSNGTRQKARRMYERTQITLRVIAARCKISKSTVQGWARTGHWKLFKRTESARTVYRNAAMTKIGRRLRPYEQVHHKDGNILNNKSGNLHVYRDAKSHSIGHGSLENCGFKLYKAGIILFDDRTGRYFLRANR
jgi:transposase-like protein